MSESDLDDALKDLDSEGEEESADAGGIGEEDLAALAEDLGGGEGETMEIDPDLAAALGGDAEGGGGGEGMDLDADLAAALDGGLGEEAGAEGDAPAPPAPAPAKAASPPVTVKSVAAGLPGMAEDSINLEFLLDVKLHVTFEVGRSKMLISDLLTLGQGSVVELHRLVGDELDFLVNGKLVAKGEVVVVNEKFGCRITDIVPPEDRIKHLSGF